MAAFYGWYIFLKAVEMAQDKLMRGRRGWRDYFSREMHRRANLGPQTVLPGWQWLWAGIVARTGFGSYKHAKFAVRDPRSFLGRADARSLPCLDGQQHMQSVESLPSSLSMYFESCVHWFYLRCHLDKSCTEGVVGEKSRQLKTELPEKKVIQYKQLQSPPISTIVLPFENSHISANLPISRQGSAPLLPHSVFGIS